MNKITLFLIVFFCSPWAAAQFIKVANTGALLSDNAAQWDCVLDDKTQLMWEVKRREPGLQNTAHTYTWFDGKSGIKNGEYSHNCQQQDGCNTQNFMQALNTQTLCQFDDWRLPNAHELRSLLRYKSYDPLIDRAYFPNTQPNLYWSSSSEKGADTAVDIAFFYGGTSGSDKSFDSSIRAVRDVK